MHRGDYFVYISVLPVNQAEAMHPFNHACRHEVNLAGEITARAIAANN
jgi:hypothetical protein